MTVAEPPIRIDDALAFSAFRYERDSDPLRGYRHACEAAKHLMENVAHAEVYWRAPNSGGKTTGGCALDVAFARGLKELGGVTLPPIAVPNVGWILTTSYKQQIDSSQKALLQWLGNWPHKIAWVQGESKGYIETVYVATALCKHGTDERCATCSRIVFHCAESNSAIGGRIDWAHADEIPPEHVWREVRARFTAGRPFYRYITATPMRRREWEWIREDFRACEGKHRPVNGRMELRSSLHDNRFLSPRQIEAVLESWQGDPLYDARSKGDYVDTEGDCPFDLPSLQRWQKSCREPAIERITVQTEKTFDDGRYLVARHCDVEVWEKPQEGATYLMVLDPSTGVKSKTHDPAGLHVYRRGSRPTLVLRYDDYLEPYGLGYLASLIGRRYHNALVDIDMTGGYGAPTVTALSQQRYHNIMRDYHEDRPGAQTGRLGFTITAVNRSEITTAIQRALLEDSVDMPSADVISCLMGVTEDEKGKWLAGPGRHDEDMICMGRALHLMSTLPAPAPKPRMDASERMGLMLGRRGLFRKRPGKPKPGIIWAPR